MQAVYDGCLRGSASWFDARALAALLGVFVGTGFLPPLPVASGGAQTCLNDATIGCYARGTFDDGSTWGGGYVQVQVATLSVTSSSAYLNEELWTTTNASTSSWAEIGYSYNQAMCRGDALRWFYFYKNPSGTSGRCFGSSPSVGTTHDLEIQEDTSSEWYIYLDGAEEALDSGTSGWNRTDYTGLEYHDGSYNHVNSNAYFSYNEVRDKTCCTWSYWNQGGTQQTYSTLFSWAWTETNPWIHGYDR